MRIKGSTTVFLSLTLTCMIALLGGLYGSARTAGCSWYAQMVLDSTLDSMMSCYHREAFDRYRLFLLEYDTADGLAAEMSEMADEYYKPVNWYELTDRQLDVERVYSITDRHGEFFEKEISDFMVASMLDPDGGGADLLSMTESFKEAETLGDVASSYQNDGNAILKLAKITDEITAAINGARQDIEDAENFLDSKNVGRFDMELGKAKRQLEKIPKLIEKYREEAVKAGEKLGKSDSFRDSKIDDMNEEGKNFTEQQKNEYHQYVDEDGTYYMKIMSLEGFPELGISILDRATDLANEISNEPCDCDDDEECDCEPDYSPVFEVLREYRSPSGFEVMEVDKAAIKQWQDQLNVLNGDLLSLILPAKTKISDYVINASALPSAKLKNLEDSDSKAAIAAGIVGKGFVLSYGKKFFPNFMTAANYEGEYPYAQEYLICGKPKARDSLRGAVDRIAAIRMAANYVDSLRDPMVTQEASRLAALASGGTPLAAALYFLIIGAWAALQTVLDLRKLMAGEKVPFYGDKGYEMSYEDYLNVLMVILNKEKLEYRMMDLMQDTIKKKQPDFLMNACAARIEAAISGKGPFVELKRSAVHEYN